MLFWMSTNVSFCGVFFNSVNNKNTSLLASLESQAYTQENKTHRFIVHCCNVETQGETLFDRQKERKAREFLF